LSNFELRYFELDQSRGGLKNCSSQVSSCANSLRRQSNALSGQRGFGIDSLRRQIQELSTQLSNQSNQVLALSNYLQQLESTTREYENSAYRLLSGVETEAKAAANFDISNVNDILKFLSSLVGGAARAVEADGGAVADWLSNLKDITGWFGVLSEILKGNYDRAVIEATIKGLGADKLAKDALVDLYKSLVGPNADALTGATIAGGVVSWAIDWAKNTYDNFYTEGNSTGRAVAETVVEGVVGMIPAAVGVGVSLAVAGAVAGAPVLLAGALAGGAAFLAKKGLDWAANKFFKSDQGFVETVSDHIIDSAIKTWNTAVGGAKSVASAVQSAAGTVADFLQNPLGLAFGF